MLGWTVAFFPPVKTDRGWRVPVGGDGRGWPDLVMVRERCLVMEVKGDGDYLKPDQARWLSAFRIAGIEAYEVTPAMWLAGEVDEILRQRKRNLQRLDEHAAVAG